MDRIPSQNQGRVLQEQYNKLNTDLEAIDQKINNIRINMQDLKNEGIETSRFYTEHQSKLSKLERKKAKIEKQIKQIKGASSKTIPDKANEVRQAIDKVKGKRPKRTPEEKGKEKVSKENEPITAKKLEEIIPPETRESLIKWARIGDEIGKISDRIDEIEKKLFSKPNQKEVKELKARQAKLVKQLPEVGKLPLTSKASEAIKPVSKILEKTEKGPQLKTDEKSQQSLTDLVNVFTLLKPEEQKAIQLQLANAVPEANDEENKNALTDLIFNLTNPPKAQGEPPKLFTKDGLSIDDLSNRVLSKRILKRKNYENEVRNFANAIMYYDINLLKFIGNPGELFPFKKENFGDDAGNQANLISIFVRQSVLKAKSFKNANKMYQFYIDVVKELDSQGNMNAIRLIAPVLTSGPVGRDRLLEKFKISTDDRDYISKLSSNLGGTAAIKFFRKREESINVYPMSKVNGEVTLSLENANLQDKAEALGSSLRPFMKTYQKAKKMDNPKTVYTHLKIPENLSDEELYNLSKELAPPKTG